MIPSPNNILRLQRVIDSVGRRAYHDIVTVPGKNKISKPIIASGPPGYSSVSGQVVTVFGCTGFLGRYLVAKLAKMGTQVIIPYRDEDEKRRLKLTGDLGQVVSMEWDLRDEAQIAECVRHSDIVYNLVGRDFETKNFSYSAVHADGAERIARITAQTGVPRFVHLSHLNASQDSPSKFYQSKAEGEERVKAAFEGATIVRPSTMFGAEDKLLNNMAIYPIWWKLNHAETKTRPVHVIDVAQALANLSLQPPVARTLNLPGPSTLTYAYLLDLVSSLTFHPPSTAPVLPKFVATQLARITAAAVWWPTLSPDEVVRRYIDDVDVQGDWDAVGVTPAEIEQYAITYIRRYRNGVNYARPAVFPGRPVPELAEE